MVSKYFKANFSRPASSPRLNGIAICRTYEHDVANPVIFNVFGFVRSDFSMLVEQQSLLDYSNLLQRMQEIRSVEPDNSKLSDDEIIERLRPRWCQSPEQKIKFEQYLIDMEIESKKSELSKLKAQEEKTSSESVEQVLESSVS